MKAQVESSSVKMCEGVRKGDSGRIHKAKKTETVKHREFTPRPMENPNDKMEEESSEEVKAYITKLQNLVPSLPKNKTLSNLEVISNVIDYIHDLRETLGFPPCGDEDFDIDCTDVQEESDDVDPIILTTASVTSANLFGEVLQEDSPRIHESLPLNPKLHPAHPQSRQPLCVISSPNGNANMISPKIEEYFQLNYEKIGHTTTRK